MKDNKTLTLLSPRMTLLFGGGQKGREPQTAPDRDARQQQRVVCEALRAVRREVGGFRRHIHGVRATQRRVGLVAAHGLKIFRNKFIFSERNSISIKLNVCIQKLR